jgi:hypothetical protein
MEKGNKRKILGMIYVEEDELIESNNANGVIGITIGLMDCVAMDVDPVEKCFSEMQMEACVKKCPHEIEFDGFDTQMEVTGGVENITDRIKENQIVADKPLVEKFVKNKVKKNDHAIATMEVNDSGRMTFTELVKKREPGTLIKKFLEAGNILKFGQTSQTTTKFKSKISNERRIFVRKMTEGFMKMRKSTIVLVSLVVVMVIAVVMETFLVLK